MRNLIRERIENNIRLYSDSANLVKYACRVQPFVQVVSEVVCMWFDDNYSEELRSDEVFRSSFNQVEIEELDAFDQFFRDRLPKIQCISEDIRELLESDEWGQVMNEARGISERLGWGVGECELASGNSWASELFYSGGKDRVMLGDEIQLSKFKVFRTRARISYLPGVFPVPTSLYEDRGLELNLPIIETTDKGFLNLDVQVVTAGYQLLSSVRFIRRA
ncbi:MAG: hypothetical protein EA418_07860 [Wenzhouxiangellaceae bacterium]|nr:MAG: hypothetical protein EA418_07860 [Wenzhouxiangellaceae bacterium]